MFGYKLNRIVLGLGFEFSRFTVNSDGDTNAVTSLAFVPTFQVHMMEKGPVALYATTGLHLGTVFGDTDMSYYYASSSSKATLVGFHLGLGLRCFLHPSFGFGVEGGFRGIWHMGKSEDTYYGSSESSTVGQSSFYGAVAFFALL